MRNKLLFSSVLLAASVSLSAQKSATITLHADQGTQGLVQELRSSTPGYLYLWWTLGRRKFGYSQYQRLSYRCVQCIERAPDFPYFVGRAVAFADEYHWMDGIGPKENRPKMVNNNWGGTIEDNSFGTHEFLNLCEMLGTEPYISGNVGSGTVEELAKWVEYMTSEGDSPMARLRRQNGRDKAWKVKYLGVGNESWGLRRKHAS